MANPWEEYAAKPAASPAPWEEYAQAKQASATDEPNTWGQAVKNVAKGAAHYATSVTGGFAGQVAGLGALGYDILANAALHPFSGSKPSEYADPTAVQDAVSNFLTYTPKNTDTLSMKIAQFPGQVVGGAGEFLKNQADKTGLPYVGSIAGGIPQALVSAAGAKASMPNEYSTEFMGKKVSVPVPENASSVAPSPVPSTAELQAAKTAAYKAADDAGVVIKPESTQKAIDIFTSVAKKENLGKMPPKLKEATDILQERLTNNEPLSLSDADKVRQKINDAQLSQDASDQRLASIIKSKYDDYLDNLAPSDTLSGNTSQALEILKSARNLNGRYKRSQMLDQMDELAALKGESNYTQSGQENALRKQYESLATKAIKGDERLTPDQLAAVKNVAAPGKAANTLRNLGKIDPGKGGASAALNQILGGGIGGAIGSAFGPLGAGAGAISGQAALGLGAHMAAKSALKGTLGRVGAAREAVVGRGLPSVGAPGGLLADTTQSVSPNAARGLLADQGVAQNTVIPPVVSPAPRTRPSTEIQADIQRLSDRVRFELSNEDASSPKVQAAIDELQTLQRELAASQANR